MHNVNNDSHSYDHLPVGIYITDATGNCTYVNLAWCEIAGITAEQAQGSGWMQAIHPDDRAHYFDAWNQALANGHPFACEYRFQHRNGRSINVLGRASKQLDQQGNTIGFIGSITDISKQVEAENRITQKHNLINAVFENSAALMLVLDRQGRIIRFNKSCETLTGYQAIEVLSQHPWDLFLPENEIEPVLKVFRELAFDAIPNQYENHWLTRDGEKRLISWHNSIIRGPDNQVDYIISSGIDITEKKVTEQALQQHKTSLAKAQQIAKMGSWDWNISSGELSWSDEIFRIFGTTPQAFPATYEAFLSYVHPDDRDSITEAVNTCITNHTPYAIDHRIVRRNGEIRMVHEEGVVYYDDQGQPSQMIGTVQDITQQKAAEAERLKLSRALEQTADSVLITNSDGIIEYVNPAFCATTGYSREEVIGNNPNLLKSGRHNEELYEKMWQTVLAGHNYRNVIVNRRKDGSTYYEEKTISPLKNEHGEISHFVSTGKDVTKSMQTQARLHHLAHHDALTNLPNRLLFMDRLSHALTRAAREKNNLTVLFLDLDNFKQINDTLGHGVGDKLLTLVAKRLTGSVRAEDTISRLGGDEFAILLENTVDIHAIGHLADKIIQAMNIPFRIEDHELLCGTSIGISIYPDDGQNADDLLKHADSAMYKAKQSGRNKHHFFQPDQKRQRG